MFRTPYPVRIKVLIFNQLKIFQLPPFLSNDSQPSIFSSCSISLLIPCPQVFISSINPSSWMVFLKFWCFSLDFARMNTKTPSFLSLWFLQILVRIGVFMPYNFSYLHLGAYIFFFLLIIKLYLFSFLIISPHNF